MSGSLAQRNDRIKNKVYNNNIIEILLADLYASLCLPDMVLISLLHPVVNIDHIHIKEYVFKKQKQNVDNRLFCDFTVKMGKWVKFTC